MIHILHGEDIDASYRRLSQILSAYPRHIKIRLTGKDNLENFYLAAFSSDFFQKEKIIVCENFLSGNVISLKDLKNIPKDQSLILWEHSQLPGPKISKFRNLAIIENFKPKSNLFSFLDSISSKPDYLLSQFAKLNLLPDSNLIWHLAFRTLLLILAKQRIDRSKATKISGKPIADWQWEKVLRQSKLLNLQTLLDFYNGLIKLDFMLKSGLTNLKEPDLIPILLLKYLRS